MSDKKISQLDLTSTLSPAAIIPVTQIDTMTTLLTTFGVTAATLWAGAGGTGVGTYFPFPNDTTTPVTTGDVGKVAMNDGSGTAKVYALSAAVAAVAGSWQVVLNSTLQSSLNSGSGLNFTDINGNGYSVYRSSWLSGTPTPYAELLQIKAAIDGLGLSLTVTPNGVDTITITENGYQGYSIKANGMPSGSFSVIQLSLAACPASPTAFPLGKIVGIQGSNVIISSNLVETYTLSGSSSLDEQVFNTANYASFDFQNNTSIGAIASVLAVPGAGGTVSMFDLSRYTLGNAFSYSFRDQLLGLILGVNGTTATVLHLNGLSPVLNFALKASWYGNNH